MTAPSCENCHRLGDRNTLITSFALRPRVDVFGLLIPVLLTLVTANVEGTNKPLFEKHCINMWTFLVGFGGYCFAIAADMNSRIHDHQADSSVIVVVTGSLSTVSLVSTLFPRVIGYIILSISWLCTVIFIVAYEDGKLYKGAYSWICKYVKEPVSTRIRNMRFHEANNSIIPSSSTDLQHAAISDTV